MTDDDTPPTREEIAAMLAEMHPGKEVVFADDSGVRAEQRGIDALLDILNIANYVFMSDDTTVGNCEATDEELAAMPVCGVTRDMTLLEALAHIRKTFPAWPDTVQ